MVKVKAHTRKINGKTITVKSYMRNPHKSARNIYDPLSIQSLAKFEPTFTNPEAQKLSSELYTVETYQLFLLQYLL